MKTELAKLKEMMAKGDHRGALKLAAKWSRLGSHKEAIQRGWAAVSNPEFYRQLGEKPDQLVALGVSAIQDRYEL